MKEQRMRMSEIWNLNQQIDALQKRRDQAIEEAMRDLGLDPKDFSAVYAEFEEAMNRKEGGDGQAK